MSDITKIGYSIRSLRKSRGMTLQQMSEATGLSIGYFSNLERNVNSPTLTNIQKICEVFDTSLGDLLERNAEEKIVIRREDREVSMDDATSVFLETIDFGSQDMSFLFMTAEPNSNADGLFWTHEYEEFGIIISGALTVLVEENSFELRTGDAIRIPAHTKHCYFNKSETEKSVSFWCKHWDHRVV